MTTYNGANHTEVNGCQFSGGATFNVGRNFIQTSQGEYFSTQIGPLGSSPKYTHMLLDLMIWYRNTNKVQEERTPGLALKSILCRTSQAN